MEDLCSQRELHSPGFIQTSVVDELPSSQSESEVQTSMHVSAPETSQHFWFGGQPQSLQQVVLSSGGSQE